MLYWYAAKCKCGQILRISYGEELILSWNSRYYINDYEHLDMYDCRFTKIDSEAIKNKHYGRPYFFE